MPRDMRVIFKRPEKLSGYPAAAADALFKQLRYCSDELRWFRITQALDRIRPEYCEASPTAAAIYEGFVQVAADEVERLRSPARAHMLRVNVTIDVASFVAHFAGIAGFEFHVRGEVPAMLHGFSRVEFHSLQMTHGSILGNMDRISKYCNDPVAQPQSR